MENIMKKSLLILLGLVTFVGGCASVEVKAPKDPIKMDISMRLDVYQHVVRDIDAIEDLVEGNVPAKSGAKKLSSLFGIGTAYAAEEDLSPETRDAAYRRRDRHAELESYQSRGVLGESKSGFVVVRGAADGRANEIVTAENADRMVIYRAIASKRQSSVQDVQKIYAERLRERVPSGTPVENADGSWSTR